MESKVKGSASTSPTKDCPTINLRDDVDVNFPSFMHDVDDVVAQPLSHESNEVAINVVTAEIQPMPDEFHDVGVNTASESTQMQCLRPRHGTRQA